MDDNTKKSKTAAYNDAFCKLTPAQTTYSQMVGSVVVRLDNPRSSSFHFSHFFWHSFRRLSQKLQSENNYSRNKFPKLIRNKNFLRLSQVRTLLTSRFLESLFADMLTFFRLSCCIISPRFSTSWDTCPTAEVPKYRQSASASSLITWSAGLVFSAIGILLSRLIISKYKPRA
jgi:hypothetical protein